MLSDLPDLSFLSALSLIHQYARQLPKISERKECDRVNEEIDRIIPNPQALPRIQEALDAMSKSLPKIKGIEVIDARPNLNENCIDVAMKGEEGYDKEKFDIHVDTDEAIRFFQKFGYRPVRNPKPGSIIAYFKKYALKKRDTWVYLAAHYGRVDEVAKDKIGVISKFGGLAVCRHRYDIVPTVYGDQVLFFTKENRALQTAKVIGLAILCLAGLYVCTKLFSGRVTDETIHA